MQLTNRCPLFPSNSLANPLHGLFTAVRGVICKQPKSVFLFIQFLLASANIGAVDIGCPEEVSTEQNRKIEEFLNGEGGACTTNKSTPAAAAERYTSGYEVNFTDGTDEYSVQTVAQFSAGEPIRQEFGDYKVSLLITEGEDSEYTMEVTVMKGGTANELSLTVLEQSFSGALGAILEFEGANDLVKVSGAIAVSRLGQ